jgi:predicted metal-dependent HD superfamily phosphohydrolase
MEMSIPTAEEAVRRWPGGEERVRWVDLLRVEVVNTAEGLCLDDLFLVLHGAAGELTASSQAAEDAFLLDRLLALPGFRTRALAEVMGITEDRTTLLWERADGDPVPAVADARVLPLPPPPVVLPSACELLVRTRARYRGRAYHSWSHVRACLDAFAPDAFERPAEVWAAILCHDAVYSAGASDNEARSAVLARAELAGLALDLDRVAEPIRLTARHGNLPPADVPDVDAGRFLDIDTSVLGAPPPVYDAYARGVRQEYARVPQLVYAVGRARFLQRVLASERIFFTEDFHARLDARARENIGRELRALGRIARWLA